MSIVLRPLVATRYVASAQTTQYTAPAGTRTVIDKATVTNAGDVNASLTVHLVPAGGVAGAENINLKEKRLAPGQSYLLPEITGHTLETGGFISTLADTTNTLTIRISGREIS